MTNAQHRVMNTVAWIAIMMAGILYALSTEDRLEECSDLLYEHLYEMEAPKDIYER